MRYFYFFISLLLIGCASQTTPTGGPKDEIAPKLISSSPQPETTNFKDNTIELNFNELIQLDKPKEQIIISPLIKDVEYTYRKNKVILKFNEQLKDSTTYTINFREAIKDLTEKNPAQDVRLAFSTGSIIDSLKIKGLTFDLLLGKTIDNVTIALQPVNDSFNIFKHKARIITKSNPKTGEFSFTNIKSGSYQIYAFTDKNNNLIVDSQNEFFSYIKTPIQLIKNVDGITLPLIKVDNRNLKLISMRNVQNYFVLKLNKSVKNFKITNPKQNLAITPSTNNTEIKIYTYDKSDSTLLNLYLSDSINQKIDTTFFAKFNQQYDVKRLEKLKVETGKSNVYNKTNDFQTYISINKPIRTINIDSIYIQYDSISRETFSHQDLTIDSVNNKITINKTLNPPTEKNKGDKSKPKKELKPYLKFGKGCIISVDQDSIPSKTINLNFLDEEALAKIYIEPLQDDEFIELLSSQNEIIQTIYGKQSNFFENVLPGEYKLRLIKDTNKNRKWDPAIPHIQQEAESVYFYFDDNLSQTFSVKANWVYGPLLIKPIYRVENMGKDKNKTTTNNRN